MISRNTDKGRFKEAVRKVLEFSDGISITLDGTVYVRTMDARLLAAGIESPAIEFDESEAIEEEVEFGNDFDSAMDYFFAAIERLNLRDEL